MLVTNDTVLAIQLTKILHDSKAAFAVEDSCLVAKPVYFQNCNIFKRDLILNTRPGIPMKSCLLDEGFNKGIYIDLSDVGQRGTLFIRLPDAKMINLMTKNLPSGELVYPRIAELASRILQVCMEGRGMNQLVGNLRKYNETGRVGGLIARYMTEVKQLLNTRENYMKTLIQPVSGGIAPKQMADKYVPEGVCVVLNDRIHETLRRKTWGDLEVTPDTFLVMGLRNPVLWQAQVTPLVVWSKDQWSEYLLSKHGIELDDYLVVEYCQHLLLMNIMDVLASQADCDGDLYPISVIPGEAAQAEFGALFDERTVQIRISEHKTIEGRVRVLPNVHTEELNWIFGKDMGDGTFMDGYTQGEVNSDAKLYDHETGTYKELPKYKLNSAVFSWEQKDEALPYNKLLSNAVTAKGKVATGTLELWHINSGTEIFRHYYYKQIEELGGYKACSKRRDTIAGIMANNGVLEPFSHADWGLMSHMYSRIVQDFIVRGKLNCRLSQ